MKPLWIFIYLFAFFLKVWIHIVAVICNTCGFYYSILNLSSNYVMKCKFCSFLFVCFIMMCAPNFLVWSLTAVAFINASNISGMKIFCVSAIFCLLLFLQNPPFIFSVWYLYFICISPPTFQLLRLALKAFYILNLQR